VPIPGASAEAAALSVAGFPAVPHLFVGFPPATAGSRQRFFRDLAPRSETIIFFEAARRLGACLAAAAEELGSRRAVVARELTKVNEEIARGALAELSEMFGARDRLLGECVVVVGPGPTVSRLEEGDWRPAAIEESKNGAPPREVAREIARRFGVSSREVYAALVSVRSRPPRGN